ncbi:MAG: Chromosome segregation protein SMC [Parcubacteria group bacterium Gr01-1014_3]|nr:MAG: Chromosome segregation protein SMC [Parcubacteria group bacterium Gr01-1014_3]
MLLKQLELVGFKSFVSKTTLDFPAGITAIVGPNGSGKSNVIDALRWLLGEREAKNIRGAKAEDLIFAGTPERPRVGMAQATIVFDNSTRFFPIDYTEIAITRKISRDGTSEYLLNGSEVRLKDIIDFFAKARLGTKGFSIINQGSSDLFVRASQEERREMIEEVLGLRQYQLKKHEAQNKLKNTKINLDKVEAMVQEILPHLRLLRRQTTRWEKHAEVEKELRTLEENYFSGRLGVIESDFSAIEPQIQKINQEVGIKNQELRKLQEELHKVEKAQPSDDKGFNDFKKQQSDVLNRKSLLQKELGRLEAQMEFLAAQPKSEIKAAEAVKLLEEVKGAIGAVLNEGDFGAVKSLLQKLIKRIDDSLQADNSGRDEKIAELDSAKKKAMADIQTVDADLNKLREAESHLNDTLKQFTGTFRRAFELVEQKKDEMARLDTEKNKILFERERVEIRRKELENLAMQSGRRLHEFSSQRGSASGGKTSDFAEMEKRMFKLRAELAGIGDLDPALVKEAQETESRYNFLSAQNEDLKKASADLALLINDLDEKIHGEFNSALKSINEEFNKYFKLLFDGGSAKLTLVKKEKKIISEAEEAMVEDLPAGRQGAAEREEDHKFDHGGIEMGISIPRKKISGLEMLSGGEKALVSVAVLFALISVSPPPFLVLDEVDAALDERNARKFAELVKDFSSKTQFIIVTHNRATMESADIMYGVTMGSDGTSRLLSVKLE